MEQNPGNKDLENKVRSKKPKDPLYFKNIIKLTRKALSIIVKSVISTFQRIIERHI